MPAFAKFFSTLKGSREIVRSRPNHDLTIQAYKFNEDDLNVLKVRFQLAAEDHVISNIPNEKIEEFPEKYFCPKVNRKMLIDEDFDIRKISNFSDSPIRTFFRKMQIVTRNPLGMPESRTDDLVADLLRVVKMNDDPLMIAQHLPRKLYILNEPYVSAEPEFVVTKGVISMVFVEDKTLENTNRLCAYGEMQIAAELLACENDNVREDSKITDQVLFGENDKKSGLDLAHPDGRRKVLTALAKIRQYLLK
ncbi:11289_t:CDS:2 [Diversispora eburnea]|uniref:11289_t:CDS:1 n=1 Tax=Diversispora eburnea TaxID=1213867 RepID=A0A9N9DCC4_9GLOM|nr:11289_t:CDS:2 [Diversispora eburnea]